MFVYGCVLSEDELLSVIGEDERARFMLEKGFDISPWNVMEKIQKEHPGFKMVSYQAVGKLAYIFGRTYESMGNKETKEDFETSVRDETKKIFNKDVETFFIEVEDRY